MRADPAFVIYAVGGGHGHARRGLLMQRALASHFGAGVPLVVRDAAALVGGPPPCGPVHVAADGAWPATLAPEARTLLIDTFPDGWLGEFPRAAQRIVAPLRVLVARAVHGGPLPGTDDFDLVLSPYGPATDEWCGRLAGAVGIGLVVGEPFAVADEGPAFVVVDPDRRADAELHDLFRRAAAKAGYAYVYVASHERRLTARKVLFIGAGYHTFYEAAFSGADVRFLPLPRRFDDQRARAARHGLVVDEPRGLLAWLRLPAASVSLFGAEEADDGFAASLAAAMESLS